MERIKRVGLTLPENLDSVLTELSILTRQPKTKLITELLLDATPVLEQVIEAIKQAKQGQEKQAIETMAKFLAEASMKLNQAHIDLGEVKVTHGK